MENETELRSDRVEISAADREALQKLAENIITGLKETQSFQDRMGSTTIRYIRIAIEQDPARRRKICLEIWDPVEGELPAFDVACWCDPPGCCETGPCPGSGIPA